MAHTKSNAKNGNSGNDTSKSDRREAQSAASHDKRGDNAKNEPRDDEGRFKRVRNFEMPDMPDVSGRSLAIGAVVLAAGVGLGAALFSSWRKDASLPNEPWSKDQLDEDIFDDDDSIELSDAPVGDAEPFIADDKRDAFAPALKPVPSRVEAMGNGDD